MRLEKEDHSAKPNVNQTFGEIAGRNNELSIEHRKLLLNGGTKLLSAARLLNMPQPANLPEHFEEAERAALVLQLLPHLRGQKTGERLYEDDYIIELAANEVKNHGPKNLVALAGVQYPEITRGGKGEFITETGLRNMRKVLKALHGESPAASVPSWRKLLSSKGINPEKIDEFVNFPESRARRKSVVRDITRFYQLLRHAPKS